MGQCSLPTELSMAAIMLSISGMTAAAEYWRVPCHVFDCNDISMRLGLQTHALSCFMNSAILVQCNR
jgi:hypothetical protein